MKSLTYVEVDVPAFPVTSPAASPEEIVTFRFALPTAYLPADIDCIPSIASVSFTPATLSLGESLGQRASLKITFNDHKHIFNGEGYDSGTFWGKWRGRYGTKLRGRALRLIRGFVGQSINSMETRHYVIEATDGPTPDAIYTIEAKDVLKLADDDRSQAPALSNGSLSGSINSSATSAALSPSGIGNLEYPSSGYLCFGGKEIVSFTRSGDNLTISRGELGSTAIQHDAGERAQLCLRYDGDDVADIIYDLLTTYAGISTDYIPLTDWQTETSANLGVIYAATITEPTSVKKLVSELIQQAALAVWWDDLAQKIRLQVLREISTDADTFDESRIIQGSLSVSEQPSKRLSQIWAYYNQRDPTDNADKQDNYANALADVDLTKEDEYGSAAINKLQCRWIATLSSAERLTQIQLSRFRDPPRAFTFDLFHNELVTLAGGYQLSWWANQDETGAEVPALIQITQISTFPDHIHVEAEEMLASGVIVLSHVIILTDTGSVKTWTVPDSWNDAENLVACIGAGGGGDAGGSTVGGNGGGAGAFSSVSNISLTPAASVSYRVGSPGQGGDQGGFFGGGSSATDGGDTWFGAVTFGAATVAAKGGQAGSGRTGGGQGGQASSGIGTLKHSGGNGGDGGSADDERGGGGGAGGAGGPNGNGANGGNGQEDNGSGAGGGAADSGSNGQNCSGGQSAENPGDGGNTRFGFGGGTSANPTGQQGAGGRGDGGTGEGVGAGGTGEQLYTQTEAPIISAGPGGGAGGGRENSSTNRGGNGGKYGGAGGGGGGNSAGGGDGAQGCIVITWKEAAGSP